MDANAEKTMKNREMLTNGSDGLSMIYKSCVASISVTTPLGEQLQYRSQFVGSDSLSYLLLKLPSIGATSIKRHFQQGFYLSVKAIADRGEGTIVCFRTKIRNVILNPIALLVLDIPTTMKLHQLRCEPRFEVSMRANVIFDQDSFQVELLDLSNSGCCFVISTHDCKLKKDDPLVIEVMNSDSEVVTSIKGKICNSRRVKEANSFGVLCDPQCKEQMEGLLARIVFGGSKMCFADSQQPGKNKVAMN